MENVSILKTEKKPLKSFIYYISNIGIPQLVSFILCFVFSKANFFGVIRPFAASLYVSVGYSGILKIFAILSITLGNLLFANFYETIRQTLSLILFEVLSHVIFKIGEKNETTFSRSVLAGLIIGFTGLLRGAVQGFHLYDLVVSVLCGILVFSFSFVLSPSSEAFQQIRRKYIFDGKTFFSKAVLLSIAVISLEGVVIWNCELGSVLAGLAVIIIARRKGSSAGALMGAVLGMVIALFDLPASLHIPGMFALAGAMAGITVKTKAMSTILWTAVVIFFSGLSILEGGLTIKYYEALVSGILFLVIPKSIISILSDELAGIRSRTEAIEIFDANKNHEAADKLFVLSKALSRVSRSIEETLSDDEEDMDSIAQWIIEAVAEKVCNRCSMCDRCWNTYFYKTYKLVEESLSNLKIDEKGQPELPSWFKSVCTKPDKFIDALETAYSIYKADKVWRQKIRESRMLLGKQAAIISGGIMTLARNLNETTQRDNEIEERLLCAASSRGMPVSGFRYNTGQESKPSLEVIFDAKNKLNATDLDEMIQENVQKNYIRIGESRRDFMGYSVVRYMKKPRYKSVTGIARVSKENQPVSGDNFAFFITSQGYHISAISDGTGSGRRAEKFSRTTIQILENMLEDGIEISLAIRFLNLYLNIRGENERLATMDICAIDLSNGETSFFKYGAPPSYIKIRQGTEKVNAEWDGDESYAAAHFRPANLSGGDFVIMFSDGVLDAFYSDEESTGIKEFIDNLDTVNTQQMADIILNEALTRSKEKRDDMTVLVTKLW